MYVHFLFRIIDKFQFVANKDESEKDADDQSGLQKLVQQGQSKGVVKCRICKEDHWTTNCPYKDTLEPLRASLAGKEEGEETEEAGAAAGGPGAQNQGGGAGGGGGGGAAGGPGGKYVPPSRRGEGSARERIGESMPDRRRSKDTHTLFQSNDFQGS